MNEKRLVISDARDEDYEFSYRVKKAAEGALVRKWFGWDEAVQRDFHRKDWSERRPSIISLDGEPVGTVAVTESDGVVEIGQLFILPTYQNRGIGSAVLRDVLQRVDEQRLVARLAFLRGNQAESLYLRNGFLPVGQTETHCHMERQPQLRPSP